MMGFGNLESREGETFVIGGSEFMLLEVYDDIVVCENEDGNDVEFDRNAFERKISVYN